MPPVTAPRRCGDPCRHGPGCPIRIPLDRRSPAPPQGVSPRGRVLPRQSAPRHPPCAHNPGSVPPIRLRCRRRTSSHMLSVAARTQLDPAPARDQGSTTLDTPRRPNSVSRRNPFRGSHRDRTMTPIRRRRSKRLYQPITPKTTVHLIARSNRSSPVVKVLCSDGRLPRVAKRPAQRLSIP